MAKEAQQPNDNPPLVFRKGVLSILVPLYNERAYARPCINRILSTPLPRGLRKEVILVDDASTDGTREVVTQLAAEHPSVVCAFYQEKNQGKGAAIRRAVAEMTGEYAIFQDADMEYDPSDYALVLEPLLEGHADVVYGSRFAPRKMRRVMFYHHALGNKFLTHLSNFTTGLDLTDMETCYKAFRADTLKTIPIRSNRFGIEPEITAKVAKRGCAVYEVPISYRGRTYMEGKKITWRDGMAAIYTILKYWLIDDCYDERIAQAYLHSLSHARRMNRWMVKSISPYLGMRILEVGAGIGNISRQLPKNDKLIVTETDPEYLSILEEAFKDNELMDVAKLDLNCQEDFDALGEAVCETVVCINVLEHIEDDVACLRRMRQLLTPGGQVVLLVPQHKWLFGSYDRIAGHYRRYTRKSLPKALTEAGFKPVKFRNFNFLPILGWWVNACLLKRKQMGRYQLKLYDMLVPLLRLVEWLLPLPGLSLICVAQRQDD